MKKTIIALSFLLAFSSLCLGYTVNVPVTSVPIVPPSGVDNAVAYATNTVYTAGTLVSAGDNDFYMCLVGGKSSNSFTVGDADTLVTQGVAVFARCPKVRKALSITNTGTNTVFFKVVGAPVSGDGFRLPASTSIIFDHEVPQEKINAISAGGTIPVSVSGW